MHAFLFISVLIEAGIIGYLAYRVRSLSVGIEAVNRIDEQVFGRLEQAEAKIEDLTEGCERMDSDVSTVVSDVRELVKTQASDSRDLGERITELVTEQENIRRKAGRPASAGYSFEATRNRAENNARKSNADHDNLVALAEG